MNFPCSSEKLARSLMAAQGFDLSVGENPAIVTKTAEFIDAILSEPHLGCATTGSMLDEIKARVDLEYSTVFTKETLPPHTK